jgi:hypothetical protein
MTLKQAICGELNNIKGWFEKASSVEGILKIAQEQTNNVNFERANKKSYSNMYGMHYPPCKYVLCFILGKAGRMDEALNLFDSLSLHDIRMGISPELRLKIRNELLKLG